MSREKNWILQTGGHITETYIDDGGDVWDYPISPDFMVHKGDRVYLCWKPDGLIFGWGEVTETPQIVVEELNPNTEWTTRRRRQVVKVMRRHGFNPKITRAMMLADSRLTKFVPDTTDDLYALELSTVKANYLNDFIRERNLEAPTGSATIRWLAEEQAPKFIVQALLTFGEQRNEGKLVEAVRLPWFELLKIIAKDPEEVYKIDPFKFEELVAGAYERDGWDEVILTPRRGDGGRDIIASKNGLGSIRIFDQVKRYSLQNHVTADEVRALVGVVSMDNNVSKGIISTTSTFSPDLLKDPYIKNLIPYKLELRPKNILLPWLESMGAP